MPKRKSDLVHLPANPNPIELARDLEQLGERRARHLELSAAKATREAYGSDMRQFTDWCTQRGAKALPCTDNVLGLYLAHLARLGRAPSTIGRKLAAIVRHHVAQQHESPRTALISEQMKGIRRGEDGQRRPVKKAPPMSTEDLLRVVRAMNSAAATHADLVARDKAAMLIGWACAMRRSEVVGLLIDDVRNTRQGWEITIGRSKTDQAGLGVTLALAPAERQKEICPVAALEQWLETRARLRGKKEGSLFWKSSEQEDHRTTLPKLIIDEPLPWHQVNRMVRRWSKLAELSASSGVPFSPHSLRAGFITEAIASGKPINTTKDRSRHVSMDVFFGYVRTALTFENNAQKGLM